LFSSSWLSSSSFLLHFFLFILPFFPSSNVHIRTTDC
jgi:hypothetical protein